MLQFSQTLFMFLDGTEWLNLLIKQEVLKYSTILIYQFYRDKESKKDEEEVNNEEDEDGLNAKEKAKKTIEGLKGDISISQEEEMSITGSNARFMIMQKLAMKDKEVRLDGYFGNKLRQCFYKFIVAGYVGGFCDSEFRQIALLRCV